MNTPATVNESQVTISDCGRALEQLDNEMQQLKCQQASTQRKIDALYTQSQLIRQLVRLL